MTRPAASPRKPRPIERGVQSQIVRLLRSLGARVWTLGTTRRRGDYHGTMQAPGLPDVIAALPARGPHQPRRLEVECKRPGGRLRPEQADYRDWCRACGIAHVVGGVDDVIGWLLAERYLRTDQVPHYRTNDRTAPTARGRSPHVE